MDEIGYHHKHDRSFRIDRPNGAGDYLLLIVKSPAFFRIDGKDKRFPANLFLLYTPDYPQHYWPDCDEYYDDWMHFGPDEEELALMNRLGMPWNTPVPVSDIQDISDILRHMCYEQYSANPHRKETVDLYFRLLIYKLHEKLLQKVLPQKMVNTVYFEKLLWIRESIYRWPGRTYSIDDMAEELSLSRSRFQHLYAEAFGTSVKSDIINSRMEQACKLLLTEKMPVGEIGRCVGYENTSYFIRLFSTTYGKTPTQYRAQMQQIHEKSKIRTEAPPEAPTDP